MNAYDFGFMLMKRAVNLISSNITPLQGIKPIAKMSPDKAVKRQISGMNTGAPGKPMGNSIASAMPKMPINKATTSL